MHARNTFLFSNREKWFKKDGKENFDVPMGCYDWAKICKLIGTYLLYQIHNVSSKENIGFYRDNRLGIFRNISGPEVERKKKDRFRIFKSNGLSITVKTNLKVAASLIFILRYLSTFKDIYQPYKKLNGKPLCINKYSNHPATVIPKIPKAISKWISDISWNKDIYNQNISYYKDALKHSGYGNTSLPYNPTQQQGQDKIEKEKRKRKLVWSNLPFSMNVKTNVGKTFLKVLQRHFAKQHFTHKIFDHNMVKTSYCCKRNMESVMPLHKKQILNPSKEYIGCISRVWNDCQLNNKYLTPNIKYHVKASNKTNNECKIYLGASETPFKERFGNHTRDFQHEKYEKCTQVRLKSHSITPVVRGSFVKRVNSKTAANYCKLCLTENFYITQSLDDKYLLNQKSELVNKCRRQNKLFLSNVKRNDTMD